MQHSMLLTPSSPVLSRPLGLVKCLLAAAILVGLLGSGSAVADASDWLPLAVGNSWTYSHDSYDYYSDESDIDFRNYTDPLFGIPRFTISVLRTEVIDSKTYFVISDMPEYWPPAPSYFIAGKKLRWVGDQLMERTADGERSLFRFGGASGASGEANYTVAIQEGTAQVSRRGSGEFNFDFNNENDDGVGGASDSESYGPALEDYSTYESGGATFVRGFGMEGCSFHRGSGDVHEFFSTLRAKQAVLNGRTVTPEQAREEAAGRASSSDATSIEWLSWGSIKQEGSP